MARSHRPNNKSGNNLWGRRSWHFCPVFLLTLLYPKAKLKHLPETSKYLRSGFTGQIKDNLGLNVQARQVSPFTSGQTDQTSVPFGQGQNCYKKKISQGNKMWLEWFPCFALLNLPFSTIANLHNWGVLNLLTHL